MEETTSLDESSAWTTTTGSTTSEWNSQVTSTIDATTTSIKHSSTTIKPTSTTLGNFQPLVDNILTGLKTCANKSNFPRESGTRKQKKKDSKIIGGVTTSENNWPWLVYLEMGCGGTIIHEQWVLTAAHCCEGENIIEARFGLHNTDDEAVSMKTSQIHIHPEYGQTSDGDAENSDWCLLKFDQSILEATDDELATQIACLPTGPLEHGKACWIAGWGDTEYESGQFSEEILSAGVNILGPDYCQKYSNVGKLNSDDICAGLPDFDGDGLTDAGKDACQGDSGGPLICVEDGRATVVAVVSRGAGCGQKGQPGLYSSTWSSKDWIVKTVTKN